MRLHWLCLLLVAASGLVYLNSFPGAYHFDDFSLLLENPRVQTSAFDYSAFWDQYGGRPLTLWSFHWNSRLFGHDPFSYHLISLLLHLVVCVELFLLICQLFGHRLLACSSALVFAVHPLQSQAVNYIWSRSVLLMAVFGLGALLLAKKQRPGLALVGFQLAVWSRTEGLFFLVPLLFLEPRRWKGLMALASLNAAAFLYSLNKYAPQELAWFHSDPWSYWMMQPMAFFRYLSLMIWPVGLNVDHHLTSAYSWSMLLGLGSFLLLFFLAVVFRRKDPVPWVGMGWVLLALAPSMVVPNSDLFNESRAYLSIAGLTLSASWLVLKCFWGQPVVLKWVVGGSAVILLASLTLNRNEIWREDVLLWEDAVLKSPAKARPRYNLGVALANAEKGSESEAHFKAALHLDPQDGFSSAALGYCAELQSEFSKAYYYYQEALRLRPDNRYAQEGLERVRKYLEDQRNHEVC